MASLVIPALLIALVAVLIALHQYHRRQPRRRIQRIQRLLDQCIARATHLGAKLGIE